MTLLDEGFLLVLRDRKARWVHPAEKRPTDLDCTEMDDAEFEMVVRKECL